MYSTSPSICCNRDYRLVGIDLINCLRGSDPNSQQIKRTDMPARRERRAGRFRLVSPVEIFPQVHLMVLPLDGR